jgi:arylsulfatase A-like enzyme
VTFLRSRPRRARGLWAALVASTLAAACAPPPEASRDRVIARLGDATDILVASSPATPHPLKIGTHTRDALRVEADAGLELRFEAPATHLSFSTAALNPRDITARVHFSIDAASNASGGEWVGLFEQAVEADDAGWIDHRIALPPAFRAGATLRLETRTEPSGPDAPTPLWGSVLLSAPERAEARTRPNVLLIVADTLGAAYLGAFGGASGVSPHIDALLSDGYSFRRAYAQYANTLVSHASLFTALYPLHHGVYPGQPARWLEESLVAHFARAGYRTAAFTEGAFVSANFGFAAGFDAYDDGAIGLEDQMRGGAARTFSRAADWLERFGRNGRFFLFVHTYEVHSPYLPEGEDSLHIARDLTPDDDRLLSREFQSARMLEHNSGRQRLEERDLARLAALHAAEIHSLDRLLGDFLGQLDALGLADDTLLVFSSDHGDQFGEHGKVGHGETLHNRVLHVPLGLRWPGVVPRGSSEVPVQLVDVMPTLLDLAGIEPAQELDGRSLAPILRAEKAPEVRAAFSEQRSARGECALLGLPERCRLDRISVQTQRFKLVESKLPAGSQLYDLREDPLERDDVAALHPDEVRRHGALLEAYRNTGEARRAEPDPADESAPSPAPVIDSDALERLRVLGYAE